MPDKISFGKTFQALEKAINISQKRHSLISSNIANLETPGYKAKDVDFQTALSEAVRSGHRTDLARTDPRHIDLGMNNATGVQAVEEKNDWNGYNWVSIDKEMTRLTENNLICNTLKI